MAQLGTVCVNLARTPAVMVVPFALAANVIFKQQLPKLVTAPLEVMGQGYTASGES